MNANANASTPAETPTAAPRIPRYNGAPLIRALQILEDNRAVQKAARAAQAKADAAKDLILGAMGAHALALIGDKKVGIKRTEVAEHVVPAYVKTTIEAL
jgi:hypothetical protein